MMRLLRRVGTSVGDLIYQIAENLANNERTDVAGFEYIHSKRRKLSPIVEERPSTPPRPSIEDDAGPLLGDDDYDFGPGTPQRPSIEPLTPVPESPRRPSIEPLTPEPEESLQTEIERLYPELRGYIDQLKSSDGKSNIFFFDWSLANGS